ncbi:hypothetical protein RMCBS344292_06624 [Rhizopus microsporus]|nr:hypothetical protein RMCBS344292_06624 [Rhizopus microsporus]
MTGISEEPLRYKLPSEFRPGTDTISKLMLQDKSILNLIAKAVVGAPDKTNVTSSTSFGYCYERFLEALHMTSLYIFTLPKSLPNLRLSSSLSLI